MRESYAGQPAGRSTLMVMAALPGAERATVADHADTVVDCNVGMPLLGTGS